jgi:transposase
VVEAVERGLGKSEAARIFGVSLSSVERYVGIAVRMRDKAVRELIVRRFMFDKEAFVYV